MKYILDSCVGIKWLLREPGSDQAISIRDDFLRGLHELFAPDIFPIEVAHALTRAERSQRITEIEGLYHFQDMLSILPELHPSLPLLPRARDLSSMARIGLYDCLYVALAEQEGCKLLTADDKLRRNLPGCPIVLLASMP